MLQRCEYINILYLTGCLCFMLYVLVKFANKCKAMMHDAYMEYRGSFFTIAILLSYCVVENLTLDLLCLNSS